MAGRSRTSFDKLQRERRRQEKQAAKRARRQGEAPEPRVSELPADESERAAGEPEGPDLSV